jgi:dihydroorotase
VLRARPAIAEGIAVAKVGALAEAHGMHIHIAHLSSAEGLAAIRRLAGSGSNVTVETCPQYLWLSDEDAPRLGTLLKMYPPVRTAADRAALREGLMRGQIGMVATDHAPHTDAEKLGTSLADAAPGNPGVQTLLLTCLELAREAGDLRLAVRWVSENPAKTLGIFPRKGAIQIGSDADLVLIDPNLRTVADLAWMRSKQRHTPFDGREFGFRIQSVYLRGEPVGPVRGQFVTP